MEGATLPPSRNGNKAHMAEHRLEGDRPSSGATTAATKLSSSPKPVWAGFSATHNVKYPNYQGFSPILIVKVPHISPPFRHTL